MTGAVGTAEPIASQDLFWPEEIKVPVLIMHGRGDWRADPVSSLALVQRLQALGKPYELIVYEDDDHGISVNAADRNRRILGWFQRHMR